MSSNTRMWRVPASVVKPGGRYSVIQDNGRMRSAPAGSKGNWFFSEKGAGVQALVLVGDPNGVKIWFGTHSGQGIDNLIPSLPDIYVGVFPFVPGDRFRGLFPMHDAAASIAKQAVGIGGAGASAAMANHGAGATAAKVGKTGAKVFQLSKTLFGSGASAPEKTGLVVVKFHYLRDSGMKKVGSGSVKFSKIRPIVSTELQKLVA